MTKRCHQTINIQKHINREISWLSFNHRVLQEAGDKSVPLVERMRFLGIYSNNLDEFFRVRVGTLKRILALGKQAKNILGDNPKKVLAQIQDLENVQRKLFAKYYHRILKELEEENIFMVNEKELSSNQAKFVEEYFQQRVRPNLIPIILYENKKFPYLKDHNIYLAIKMTVKKGPSKYALVTLPSKFCATLFAIAITRRPKVHHLIGRCNSLLPERHFPHFPVF